jgi:hypothetical protein
MCIRDSNWSSSADERNDENTLIIHNQDIANQYYQEFVKRWGYAVLVGLKESSLVNEKLDVYPNPSNGKIWIDFEVESEQEVSIDIYDLTGRIVYSESKNFIPGEYKQELCLDNLINGLYILKLKGDGFSKQQKLIVK